MKKFWNWKSRKIRDQASGEEVSERVLFLNGTIAEESWFDDDVLQRADASEGEDLEAPEVSMLYSRAAVTNSLMERIAAKCHIKAPESGAATEQTTDNGRSCDEIRERLNFIKRFI